MNSSAGLYEAVAAYGSVAITGICKNAGKTTALNALIRELRKRDIIPALSSVGRDGEELDIATRTKKPRIYIYEGTIFATAKDLLGRCDVTRELICSAGMNTPLGEIVICRALSDGYVQLGGPSIGSQVKRLEGLFAEFGVGKIIIDGAINRRSLSSPALCDCCVLCAGASYSRSMDKTVEETGFIAKLFALPSITERGAGILRLRARDENLVFINKDYSYSAFLVDTNLSSRDAIIAGLGSGTKYVFIGGAVTDGAAEAVISSGAKGVLIAAEDTSKILTSKRAYERLLLSGNGIVLLSATKLVAVCVNPFSSYGFDYDARDFARKTRFALGPDVPVYNVLEEII